MLHKYERFILKLRTMKHMKTYRTSISADCPSSDLQRTISSLWINFIMKSNEN